MTYLEPGTFHLEHLPDHSYPASIDMTQGDTFPAILLEFVAEPV